ncbi:DUF5347 domain-containing protein, partial [Klebsiella pneumoniae]|nr:DUF5347 domain-containing protein [Klebsiella pneumoniae]
LLCHGTVCVVGKIRDLILQLSKSSIYSTKPISINELTTDEKRELIKAMNHFRAVVSLFPRRLTMPN